MKVFHSAVFSVLVWVVLLLLMGSHHSTAFSSSFTTESLPSSIVTSNSKELLPQQGGSNNDEQQQVDVAIVGAGPAGLVLAHSLINRGYSVKILERRSSFRPVGSAVFLHPFALNSLRSLSPEVAENVLEVATQIGTITVKSTTNSENNAVFGAFDKAPDVFGAPFVTIKFWDLLQALRKGLPDDIFSFDRDVQSYREIEEEGRVELLYNYSSSITSGTTTNVGNKEDSSPKEEDVVGTLKARIVIDAGGIRSKIRKQISPDSQSVPFCKAYMAVVPAEKANPVMQKKDNGEETMVDRELSFLIGDVDGMTLATLGNGDVWWTYTYFDDDLQSSLSRDQLVQRFESTKFPPFVKELVGVTEDRIETVIADLPVSWKWGVGSVTLLGDAAHAQLPALGLGCSAAFADIEELCRQIDSNGLSPKSLRWYETLRMPQTAVLQTASRFTFGSMRNLGMQK